MKALKIPHQNYHVFEMYVPTRVWKGTSPVARETEQMMQDRFGGSTVVPNLVGKYRGELESITLCRFFAPVAARKSADSIARFLHGRAQMIAEEAGESEVWVVYVGVQTVISARNRRREEKRKSGAKV